MRKKILTTAVVMAMAAALVGCGASNGGSVNDNTETAQEEAASEETSEGENNESDQTEETNQAVSTEETSETEGSGDGSNQSGNVEASDGTQNEESEKSSDYSIVTTALNAEVEKFASDVKDAVLSSDWNALGDMISYPITIGGNEVSDKDAFVSLLNEKGAQAEFVTAIENESCKGLFANGQGICMGSGEVWFVDMNYDGIEQKGDPDFKIITFNGII